MNILYDMRPGLESLNEAASHGDYLQGFKGLYLYDSDKYTQGTIQNVIRWAMDTLRKHSRIVWFLRWYKIGLFEDSVGRYYSPGSGYEFDPDDLEEVPRNRRGDVKKYVRELKKMEQHGVDQEDMARAVDDWRPIDVMQKLNVYFKETMLRNVPSISDYEPGYKTPEQVLEELDELSRQHSGSAYESHRYIGLYMAGEWGWKTELEINESWVWVWIPYDESHELAKAMSGPTGTGHCGKCNDVHSTFLVLMERVERGGEPYGIPHLSLELTHNHMLTQMKGYKNQKPTSKYYDYIVDLLIESDRIEGITNSPYLPETDFHLEDLDGEQLDRVMAAKPDIDQRNNRPNLLREWSEHGASREWLDMVKMYVDPELRFLGIPRVINGKWDRQTHMTYYPGFYNIHDLVTIIGSDRFYEMKEMIRGNRSPEDSLRIMAWFMDTLNKVERFRVSAPNLEQTPGVVTFLKQNLSFDIKAIDLMHLISHFADENWDGESVVFQNGMSSLVHGLIEKVFEENPWFPGSSYEREAWEYFPVLSDKVFKERVGEGVARHILRMNTQNNMYN